MYKKEYKQPQIKVVNLDSSDIICTSTEILGRGRVVVEEEDDDTPTPDRSGFIWGE